uniref:Uncharacterized protein n=1 Tax=Romanomermis culicivorax TaxID=13658 RepID=A0A915J9D9_ROMCU
MKDDVGLTKSRGSNDYSIVNFISTIFSIPQVISSPDFTVLTPDGVPVNTKSPGSKVINFVI